MAHPRKFNYSARMEDGRVKLGQIYAMGHCSAIINVANQLNTEALRTVTVSLAATEIGQLITDPINQTPPEFGLDSNKIYGVD